MRARVVYKMNLHVVVTRCDSIYYDSICIYMLKAKMISEAIDGNYIQLVGLY